MVRADAAEAKPFRGTVPRAGNAGRTTRPPRSPAPRRRMEKPAGSAARAGFPMPATRRAPASISERVADGRVDRDRVQARPGALAGGQLGLGVDEGLEHGGVDERVLVDLEGAAEPGGA